MSLSPLFAAKRRRSMDPSILKSTSESEEEQTADRKVSVPIDPAGLSIPNRRHVEARSSCFDLDMNTIKALQEKADKAMGKVSSQTDEGEGEEESISEDENSDDGSNIDDKCSEEQDIDDVSTNECSSAAIQESCSHHRTRANTTCGAFTYREEASHRERKTSEILVSVGDASKSDFKPVSFTFNMEELQRNNRLVSESTCIHNASLNHTDLKESHEETERQSDGDSCDISFNQGQNSGADSCHISLNQGQKFVFKPQKLTLRLDESILSDAQNRSTDENTDEVPRICVNDELIVTSPPPIPVGFNNNIEKMDKNGLGTTTSLQTSSSLNFGHVNKIADDVQSITVKLERLNGVQFTSDHVSCGVRRSSTGSAPC